jgi:hypothetical protein
MPDELLTKLWLRVQYHLQLLLAQSGVSSEVEQRRRLQEEMFWWNLLPHQAETEIPSLFRNASQLGLLFELLPDRGYLIPDPQALEHGLSATDLYLIDLPLMTRAYVMTHEQFGPYVLKLEKPPPSWERKPLRGVAAGR